MADHDKPEKVTPDPGLVGREIPQGAIAIGESHMHESSAVQLRPILTTAAAMVLIVVISDVGLYGLYKFWQAREAAHDRAESPLLTIKQPIADPKLQVDEPAALVTHQEQMLAPVEGYKRLPDGKVSVPIEDAMRKLAASGQLPSGPEWSLRPDERMIGGVIMTPEQVQYANTPPSQAPAGSPPATPPRASQPSTTTPAPPAVPAPLPAQRPAAQQAPPN